jgi:predicted nucleic acid-binding protein
VIRLVVDASVAVKWFLPEVHSKAALRTLNENIELVAPDLIWGEVGNDVWKRWRLGEIGSDSARTLLSDFRRAPLRISESKMLMEAAWDIAEGFDRSIYDSLYLALAAITDCSLVTADRKLYNAFKGKPSQARLVWVEDIP